MLPDLPKGSYTCTVSRHAFHPHLIASTSMDQHLMCLILLKVEQSPITKASFSRLSDVRPLSTQASFSILQCYKSNSSKNYTAVLFITQLFA